MRYTFYPQVLSQVFLATEPKTETSLPAAGVSPIARGAGASDLAGESSAFLKAEAPRPHASGMNRTTTTTVTHADGTVISVATTSVPSCTLRPTLKIVIDTVRNNCTEGHLPLSVPVAESPRKRRRRLRDPAGALRFLDQARKTRMSAGVRGVRPADIRVFRAWSRNLRAPAGSAGRTDSAVRILHHDSSVRARQLAAPAVGDKTLFVGSCAAPPGPAAILFFSPSCTGRGTGGTGG